MLLRNSSNKPIRIDNYKILKQLGKGGFGVVYQVRDTNNTDKEYALKLLHRAYNVKRLKNQLEVLEVLNQSNLFLKTYTAKKMGGQFYLLMDYANDLNLEKIVKKELFLEEQIIPIFDDILNALEYLQKYNIIHGDIKAENIMKKDNQYFLIDFDIAKLFVGMKTVHIQSDNDFTAPEIYEGIHDYASDIYSLGCTLYYMLSKKHIYNFDSSYKLSKKMFSHLFLEPRENTLISHKMMYLIRRMTDKDYKKRATIPEIREILKDTKVYEKSKIQDKKDLEIFISEASLYKAMADAGVSYAQNVLGLMYEQGLDIQKDIYHAFRWYEISAKQGLAKAQFNLALCYKMAKGCKQDYKKAYQFFTYASEQNHNRSFFELAKMYEGGLGVERSLKKSHDLYKKAAMNGYKPAYKKLKSLQK